MPITGALSGVLDVRDAAAKILDNTTLADLMNKSPAGSGRRSGKKKKTETPFAADAACRWERGHD